MPGTLHTLAISLKGKHDVSHFKWKKLRTITKVRGLTPGRGTEEDTLRSRFQGRAIWPPELTPSPSHRVHSRSVILVSRLLSREGQSHGLSPSSKCPYHSCHSPQPDPSPQSETSAVVGPANDVFWRVPNRVKYSTTNPRSMWGWECWPPVLLKISILVWLPQNWTTNSVLLARSLTRNS